MSYNVIELKGYQKMINLAWMSTLYIQVTLKGPIKSKTIAYTKVPLALVMRLKWDIMQDYCRCFYLCLCTSHGPNKMNSLLDYH